MRTTTWTLRTPYGLSRGKTRFHAEKGRWWLLTHSDTTGAMLVDALASPPPARTLDPQAVVAELLPHKNLVNLHVFASDKTRDRFRREMPLAWRALRVADSRLRNPLLRVRIAWHRSFSP